jgi:hypothetical protein
LVSDRGYAGALVAEVLNRGFHGSVSWLRTVCGKAALSPAMFVSADVT